MRSSTFIVILVFITSCNHEVKITGHWRPADAFESVQEPKEILPVFRDLMLNSDSTFVVVGLDQNRNKPASWHNGDTQKGR